MKAKTKIAGAALQKGRGEYTVVYERDEDGTWIVSVKDVQGCRSDGRSIANARGRIRQALALWFRDARTAELHDEIRLPRELRRLVESLRSSRHGLELAQRRFDAAVAAVVPGLAAADLSVRDAGELLHYSPQRIAQLLAEHGAKRAASQKKRRASA